MLPSISRRYELLIDAGHDNMRRFATKSCQRQDAVPSLMRCRYGRRHSEQPSRQIRRLRFQHSRQPADAATCRMLPQAKGQDSAAPIRADTS